MEKKLTVGLCIAVFIAGFVAASLNPVRSWVEHNWPEPGIDEDEKFFSRYFSSEVSETDFSVVHVGKLHSIHPWNPDPPGAYAVICQKDKSFFLWYDNPLEKNVSYQMFNHRRGEKEKEIAETIHRSHPDFAVMRIMDVEDWVEEVPSLTGKWGWTIENGRYVAEYVRPPSCGFFGDPPPRASHAMLLTENGQIVDNKQIYKPR